MPGVRGCAKAEVCANCVQGFRAKINQAVRSNSNRLTFNLLFGGPTWA